MTVQMDAQTQIVIYQSKDGETQLEVRLEKETVWLNQYQMADLFESSRGNVADHILNVYKEGELDKAATCRKFRQVRQEGNRQVKRDIDHYNLDVIISVGYRVKSKRGTQFRIWANQIIKDYLVKGYVLNEQRLTEARDRLEEVSGNLRLMSRIIKQKSLSADENHAFLTLICDYAFALDLLDKYDHQTVDDPKSDLKDTFRITTKEALAALSKLKQQTKAGDLFATPKDKSFDSSLSGIYQTFDGNELYPALEDKAAHLLYFVVKNHSFVDGNKRIGAFLFIWFLDRNKALLDENGLRRISNETLIALTILVAESKPEEKEIIIRLIKHLIKTGGE
jgi:prophage maintenance system killer protein